MGKIIVITSGKGGVGKTTVTAGLGSALSKRGQKVLLADTDFGLRNLDLVLGSESSVVYDILDCLDGRCTFEDAVITFPDNENLFFLPASQSRSGKHIDEEKFSEFFNELREDFDFILLDSPAGLGPVFEMDAKVSDSALIVVNTYITSVRDSDRCIDMLMRAGVEELSLVINSYRNDLVQNGTMMKPEFVMDLLGIPLIGIVPYDESQLNRAQVKENSPAEIAFSNVAGRFLGEKIPVSVLNKEKISLGKRFMSMFKKEKNI